MVQLRVGPVPSGDEWQCDERRCVRDWRRPSKYINEVEIKRAYKVGDDALVCTAAMSGMADEVTAAVDAWMGRVCDELSVTPL